ncbi:MAG: outer membrane beta-barrel protein [Nitrosomonas ureae]
MKLTIKKALGIFALVAFMPSMVFAQSADVSALENQVKELTKKVAALEGAGTQSSYGAGYVMPTEGDQGGLLHAAQDIDFGGYVATTYTSHFGQNGTWQGRIFDANEGFAVNQADFYFKKDAPAEGGAGFKIDIIAGRDARVIDFAPTSDNDDFAFNEAYVEVNTPSLLGESDILPSMINWKVGRMSTLAGREVINPAANWNISRSVGFGFGLPFTHTGLRANTKWFGDKVNVYAGLNNGWDVDVETNDFRTMEFGLGFNILENVSYFSAIYFGPETAGVTDDKTFLWTHVLDWSVTEALKLGTELNWGRTNDIMVGTDTGNAEFATFGFYGRYQIAPKWAAAQRIEIFRDIDGSRGAGFGAGAASGTDTMFGWTSTLEYTPYDNLITRLEYRLDKANSGNGQVFGTDSTRGTLAAQMIYTI